MQSNTEECSIYILQRKNGLSLGKNERGTLAQLGSPSISSPQPPPKLKQGLHRGTSQVEADALRLGSKSDLEAKES